MVINSLKQNAVPPGYPTEICVQFVWPIGQVRNGESSSVIQVCSISFQFPTGYLSMAASQMSDTSNYHQLVVANTMINITSTCHFRLFSPPVLQCVLPQLPKENDVQSPIKVKAVTATLMSPLMHVASHFLMEGNMLTIQTNSK